MMASLVAEERKASASGRSQHDAPAQAALSEPETGASTQGRGQGQGQATPQAEAAVVDMHTYDGWDDPSAFHGPSLTLEYFKEKVSAAHRQALRTLSRAIVCACAEGNDEYPSSEEPYSFDPPFGVHESLFSRRKWRDLRTDLAPLTPVTWFLHMVAFFVVHLGFSIAMQQANHLTLQCQLTAMWWPAGLALFAFLWYGGWALIPLFASSVLYNFWFISQGQDAVVYVGPLEGGPVCNPTAFAFPWGLSATLGGAFLFAIMDTAFVGVAGVIMRQLPLPLPRVPMPTPLGRQVDVAAMLVSVALTSIFTCGFSALFLGLLGILDSEDALRYCRPAPQHRAQDQPQADKRTGPPEALSILMLPARCRNDSTDGWLAESTTSGPGPVT